MVTQRRSNDVEEMRKVAQQAEGTDKQVVRESKDDKKERLNEKKKVKKRKGMRVMWGVEMREREKNRIR